MGISNIALATLNTLGNPFQVDNLLLRYTAIAVFFEFVRAENRFVNPPPRRGKYSWGACSAASMKQQG
ncbi:MAG: hypothetical protein KGJ07_03350 [Patescibacteria group bacterium]|nr:hypothetical protein [Patescibacteria group bacterium]MDE2588856.1 hypothetical protein [Patescibacteria group bacterium]